MASEKQPSQFPKHRFQKPYGFDFSLNDLLVPHFPYVLMDSLNKLLSLGDRLTHMWDTLESKGFKLPSIIYLQIEEIRDRTNQEKPYDYFFIENLKEHIGLYDVDVEQLSNQRKMRTFSHYQSEYISDLLQIGFFDHKGSEATRLVYDPNEFLYNRLGFSDQQRKKEMICGYQSQIDAEIAHLSPELDTLLKHEHNMIIDKYSGLNVCKPTPSQICSMLDSLFHPLNLKSIYSNKRKGWFVYEIALDEHLALFLEYDDHYGMLNGRSWPLCINFAPIGTRWSYRYFPEKYLFLDVGSVLIEGQWYMSHRGEWSRIVFGAYLMKEIIGWIIENWET